MHHEVPTLGGSDQATDAVGHSSYVDKSLTPPIYRLGARKLHQWPLQQREKAKGPAQLPCGPGNSALQRLADFENSDVCELHDRRRDLFVRIYVNEYGH
jgi:hypothetical protein